MPNRLTPFLASLAVVAASVLPASAAVAQSPATSPAPAPGIVVASPNPAPSTAPGSPTPADLRPEGTWLVTAYDAWGGGLVEPLQGSTLTVSLLPQGRLEGETACGTYIGGYSVDGDAIRLGVISKGPDPCGGRRTDEAFAFTQALALATSWTAGSSGLELRDENGQPRVVLVRPDGGGLVGAWAVQRVARPAGALRPVLEGTEVAVAFGEDGEVQGSTGCRLFEARYSVETDRIVIAPVVMLGLPCEGDQRRQDRRVAAVLDAAVRWQRDGQLLLLLDANGDLLAELAPASIVPEPELPGADASAAPAELTGSPAPNETTG